MSEYIRTTRECSVEQLHPELLEAIQNYFQEHALGHLPSETLACCETVSRRKNAGKAASWLSGTPDTTIYTAMLLTSEWFIWVHYGDQSGVILNSANLSEIRAEFYNPLLMRDAGLEIVGYIGNAKGRVRGYLPMGTDLAAQNFGETVKQATIKANAAKPNQLFKWLSGR